MGGCGEDVERTVLGFHIVTVEVLMMSSSPVEILLNIFSLLWVLFEANNQL